jgi:membrane associated rhomboid family serine protease
VQPPLEGSDLRTRERTLLQRHEFAIEKARNWAVASTVSVFAAVGAWIEWGGASVRAGSFFLVGLSLLWARNKIVEYRVARRANPFAELVETGEARAQKAVQDNEALQFTARPPRVTWMLVACVALVTFSQVAAGRNSSVALAGLVKDKVRAGEWWRLATAPLLHGSVWHFLLNQQAVLLFGAVGEVFAPRMRIALVFVVAALVGELASMIVMPNTSSIGASGGILGIVGYLLVLTYLRPSDVPTWLREVTLGTIAVTAYLGVFGFAFIDNAAHAGGLLAGGLVGRVLIARSPKAVTEDSAVSAVLSAGAVVAVIAGAVLAMRTLTAWMWG